MGQFPGIRIGRHTSPNFPDDVAEALGKIGEGPSGRRLLEAIEGLSVREKTVTIVEAAPNEPPSTLPRLTPSQRIALGSHPTLDDFREAISQHATGSNASDQRGIAAEVAWRKSMAETNLDGEGVPVPGTDPSHAFISLAHELVHAKHQLAGTMLHGGKIRSRASTAETPSGQEELRATGLGPYANTAEPSENAIRAEHGLPLRQAYHRSGNW